MPRIAKNCAQCGYPVQAIEEKKIVRFWNTITQEWEKIFHYENDEKFICSNPTPTKYCNPVKIKIYDIPGS